VWLPIRAVGPTLLANLCNQSTVIVSQLAVVPLLLSHWGVGGLGTWLLLMAVPTYLGISDLGFTTSAKTDMSARVVRGDGAGAQVTISSVAALLGAALVGVGALYLAVVFLVAWTEVFQLVALSLDEARLVLCWGLLQIAAYQAFLLAAAVVRAAGRPATEVLLNALFRAAETLALVIVVSTGGGITGAAAAWAVTRLVTTIGLWLVLAVRAPALLPRWRLMDWRRVRLLLRPSLGYMLLPLAAAIIIQGTVLVLGVVASPLAVATYSTFRIVTRLGVSAANTVSYSFTPHYTYASGADERARFGALLRVHAGLLFSGTAIYLLVIWWLGPLFVRMLSRGAVDVDSGVLWILAGAAALEMLWSLPLAIGSAVNLVAALSMTYLGLAILCLGLTVALTPSLGLVGAATALALAQLTMAAVAFVWLGRGPPRGFTATLTAN
jgi:O-antigen/teichoic acid export membrane protein